PVDGTRDHVQPVRVDLAAAAQALRHDRDQLTVYRHVRRPLPVRADPPAAPDHQVVVVHDSTVTRPRPASARSHASAASSVPAACSTVHATRPGSPARTASRNRSSPRWIGGAAVRSETEAPTRTPVAEKPGSSSTRTADPADTRSSV